jgi:hypothetical protein
MLNEKSFNQAINTIKTGSEALATAIHNAGIFAIAQANEHGNIGFGTRLIEAMGRKHDVKRVEKWLCTFGKFGMKAGVLVYRNRKDIKAETLQAFIDKAEVIPYWELTEQEHHVFSVDYLSALYSLFNKSKKAEELRLEGKEVDEKNVAILEEIKTLLLRHELSAQTAVAA